jgi:hypothetical protein
MQVLLMNDPYHHLFVTEVDLSCNKTIQYAKGHYSFKRDGVLYTCGFIILGDHILNKASLNQAYPLV